ncbi:MAG: MliC family protein [Sphingomonas sp.]|nr:MliC family protein [Sphingomonas sp.]
MTKCRMLTVALAVPLILVACGDMGQDLARERAANEAAAAANAAQPPGTVVVDVSYTCQPAMTLAVRYDNSDPAASTAQVTLDGAQYQMAQVQAADGAKYMSGTGRAEGRTLAWWNRGNEGTLLEGSASDPTVPETEVATCTEAAAPAAE